MADIGTKTKAKPVSKDALVMQRLPEIGKVLYGVQWQADMARGLDISKSMVSRVLNSTRQVPDDLAHKLKALILDKIEAELSILSHLDVSDTKMTEAHALMHEIRQLLCE